MNTEQKAKHYDEAIVRAKAMIKVAANQDEAIGFANTIFPELTELEDERIRQKFIKLVKMSNEVGGFALHKWEADEMLAWLEKQSEQKSTDTCCSSIINDKEFPASEKRNFGYFIKPKFHEGDWVVDNKSGITQQVLDFRGGIYTCTYNSFTIDCESNYHLWTIKDAKNGDVLQLGTVTAIFKKYIGQEKCICYCSIDEDGVFEIPIEDGEDNIYGCTNTTPATKEQRALLFAKMEEAGYEYNLNKKELKNVDKKHIIEMKSPEESLGISSKEYNEIVNDCLYGESTPAEGVKKQSTEHQNEEELSDFEAALFSAFSDGWHQYLNGEEVDVAQWAREHSTELLEAAKEKLKKQSEQKPTVCSEKDKEIIKRIASFMWKNRKGDTDEIFQQEQDVKWLNLLIGENS